MAVENNNGEQGLKEDDIMRMLFGKKITELTSGGFEGSNEEKQIIEDVFSRKVYNHTEKQLKRHWNECSSKNKDPIHGSSNISHIDSLQQGALEIGSSSSNSVQQVTCRIVESFGRGFLSSYNLFFSQREKIVSQDYNNAVNSKARSNRKEIRNGKICTKSKSNTSPSLNPLESNKTEASMDQISEACNTLGSESIDIAGNGALCKFLVSHLRTNAHRLLIDAHWKIDMRRRKDRTKKDYVYQNPDGGPQIFSLPRAWLSFSKWLSTNSSGSKENDSGRQWVDIDEFFCDLMNTLAYIEEEVQQQDNSLTLLSQWQLLDPFMAVVCIDKMIRALREGIALKAVNSATSAFTPTQCMILRSKNVYRVHHSHAKSRTFLHHRSRKSLLPLFLADTQPEILGNSCKGTVSSLESGDKSRDGKPKNKFCCGEDVQNRSIRSLARRVGKGLCDARDRNTKNSKNVSLSDKLTQTCFKCKLPHRSSCPKASKASTCHASTVANTAGLDRQAHKPNREVGIPNPDEGLLTGKQPFEETTSNQHKEKNSNQERDRFYQKSDLVISENQRGGSAKVAQDGVQLSSVSHGGSDNTNFNLKEGDRFAGTLRSSTNFGATGSLFTLNQMPGHLMPEQQVFLLFPRDGTVSFGQNQIYSPEIFANLNMSNALTRVNMQQNPQSSVHQASLIQGLLVFDVNSSIVENLESPLSWQAFSPVLTPAKEIVKECMVPQSNKKRTLTSASNKKARKKSKKISEIEERNGNEKYATRSPPSENCRDLDLSAHQNEGKKLTQGSTSECLEHSVSLGKQCCASLENLATVHASSREEVELRAKSSEKVSGSEKQDTKGNARQESIEEPQGTSLKISDEDNYRCIGENNMENNAVEANSSASTSIDCRNSIMLKKNSASKEPYNQIEDGMIPTELKREDNNCSEVAIGGGEPPELQSNEEVQKLKRRRKRRKSRFDDDDLLISIIINNKTSHSRNTASRIKVWKSDALRRLEKATAKTGNRFSDQKLFTGARTVLNRLIEMGACSVHNIIQYRRLEDNLVLKNGRITRNGILCRCCDKIFTMSNFKFHADSELRGSSLNLYLGSGKPYTLSQFLAWSTEYKGRRDCMQLTDAQVDQNDDSCGLCGDGGELICCDNCPASYHRECLASQEIPEGSWYCPSCTCGVCGGALNEKLMMADLECSQCEQRYHVKCIKDNGIYIKGVGSDTWFCGRKCHQVYLGLRSHVGVANCIEDGFSWSILRVSHNDLKLQSAEKIALLAECNIKLSIALSIIEQSFLPIIDPRTGTNVIPLVLYNWGVHGVAVAEMPLIATCIKYRRRGMCRRLMTAIEMMLRSLKVEMLVLCAIPNLVDTWTSAFGFEPVEETEKMQLSKLKLMSFPGTILLKKSLCESSLEGSGKGSDYYLYRQVVSHLGSLSISTDRSTSSALRAYKLGDVNYETFPVPGVQTFNLSEIADDDKDHDFYPRSPSSEGTAKMIGNKGASENMNLHAQVGTADGSRNYFPGESSNSIRMLESTYGDFIFQETTGNGLLLPTPDF
ncbi:uncharacterized protein LOC109726237 isoform X3 [Ananas comosus]|uniref:Uncharacterized protein LOC109726237 isoform X3 n=1 Tax=Ananas comosus TaxID=4615 RepID=A0A6P5GU05_ANACO|nr:uncharacterized protein LOC109726237 isoform X3 [Ananas comosus]